MRRHDFKEMESALSSPVTRDLFGQLLVRNYRKQPSSLSDLDGHARVTVVGNGPLASCMAQMLSRDLPDVSCHGLCFDAGGSGHLEVRALLATVRDSDLLFIVCGFDDPYGGALFRMIADAAVESGVLTVGVVPEGELYSEFAPLVSSLWPVSCAALHPGLSGDGVSLQQRSAWSGYAMRHLVATISNLTTTRSLICIDFADIRSILTAGRTGRLGVGVAGSGSGHIASLLALERLESQGCQPGSASAVLVCVYGSDLIRMEDFDEASGIVHERFPDDASVVVGLLMDQSLGNNVRVTALALQTD